MTWSRIRFFRYVPYARTAEFESAGWIYAGSLGPPHCSYSLLMEWPVYWGA